jgi:hypothetical protein
LGSFLKSVKNQLQEILQYNKPDHLETEPTLPFFEEKTRIAEIERRTLFRQGNRILFGLGNPLLNQN